MLQQVDSYIEQLKKLGLGGIKADAPEPNCQLCKDLGTYEVFFFADREHPIITVGKVYEVIGNGWQGKIHYSEAHRCKHCFPRFEKKHNDLLESLKEASNKVDELMVKAELAKLWGRGAKQS